MPAAWPDHAWPHPEQVLRMALKKNAFQQLRPNHRHVELEDKSARMEGEPLAEMRIKSRIVFDNYHPLSVLKLLPIGAPLKCP